MSRGLSPLASGALAQAMGGFSMQLNLHVVKGNLMHGLSHCPLASF